MKYVALFVLIQFVALWLGLLGLPVVAIAAACKFWQPWDTSPPARFMWKSRALWLWDNAENGIAGPNPLTPWKVFVFSALRNPVNNLRFVPGVSKIGRPLFQRFWRKWYFQAGWRQDTGWPVLSAGLK